jgi:hypothetical protein
MRLKHGANHSPIDYSYPRTPVLLLLLSSLLLLSILVAFAVFPSASAMGPPPSTCPNLYAGTLTALVVSYPGGTVDAVANPNVTVVVPIGQQYSVTVTVRVAPASASGSTTNGSLWFSQDAYGSIESFCAPSPGFEGSPVVAGGTFTVTFVGVYDPLESPTSLPVQHVYWQTPHAINGSLSPGFWGYSTAEYNVRWIAAVTTATSPTSYSSSVAAVPAAPLTVALTRFIMFILSVLSSLAR